MYLQKNSDKANFDIVNCSIIIEEFHCSNLSTNIFFQLNYPTLVFFSASKKLMTTRKKTTKQPSKDQIKLVIMTWQFFSPIVENLSPSRIFFFGGVGWGKVEEIFKFPC